MLTRLINGFSRTATAALDLIYPRICVGCGCPVGYDGHLLCGKCLLTLSVIHAPFCRHCGDPVAGHVEHDYLCSYCKRRPPSFRAARSAVRYRGAAQKLIKALKYQGMTAVADDAVPLLAAVVASFYSGVKFDAVLGVPLHHKRRRSRGYNQSALLANKLGRWLDVPSPQFVVYRRRNTPSQTGLSLAARNRNVSGAFAVRRPEWIEGRRVLLVDDVMTTGATVNACSRALVKAGAASVRVATVARG